MSLRFPLAPLAVAVAALISGCVAVQFSDPNQIDSATAAALEKQVPTYHESELENKPDYIRAGSIDTYLCRKGLIGTMTDDKVITVLRQKANAAGANGLTDVSCQPGPVDELNGCMASIACQATLIKIVTPDTANK